VKPDRLTKSNEALLILGFIGALMVSRVHLRRVALREQGMTFTSPSR
jgi:hypothetical protein